MSARRLLFCSYHCLADPASGAARSAADLLTLLANRGWSCEALCGPRTDFAEPVPLADILRPHQPGARLLLTGADPNSSLRLFRHGAFPVSLWAPDGPEPSKAVTPAAGRLFLACLDARLGEFRPDVLLTYGGDWLAREVIRRAAGRGVAVAFWLRNTSYADPSLFAGVRRVIVPSAFCREHYRRTLGLGCVALPSPLDWTRISCAATEPRYLTFVTPQRTKGVYFWAGIVRAVQACRSDIPHLVVTGRAGLGWRQRAGLDQLSPPFPEPSGLLRPASVPYTTDPREIYAVSKVILMPSLWPEPSGRVAAEACVNGIPVLASTRGGLPETLAEAGFLFDVPPAYTPQTRVIPPPAVVQPWVETILRLWDDPAFYAAAAARGRAAAEAWRPEVLGPRYEEALAG